MKEEVRDKLELALRLADQNNFLDAIEINDELNQ
jgi:hypothetical protein